MINPQFNAGPELMALLLKGANIPARYAGNNLANCRQHDGWSLACNQLFAHTSSRSSGNVSVICGARGTGKTQMACELMRHCASTLSAFTRYEVFMDYLDYLRQPARMQEDYDLYTAPRLLVLDEIAKAGDSAWAESRLFHLVNARYNALKHTVLITAAGPDQLNDILSPSVADRVNEGGAVIHLNWPSFRNKTP